MMKVLINNAQLLDTVTFIHKINDKVSIVIEDNVEGDMEFELKFIKDENVDKPQIGYTPTGKLKATIELVNLGYRGTTKEMIPLGSYKNDYKLYFHCSSQSISEDMRETVLVFYIEKN